MVLLWAAQVASAGLLDGGVSRGCAERQEGGLQPWLLSQPQQGWDYCLWQGVGLAGFQGSLSTRAML